VQCTGPTFSGDDGLVIRRRTLLLSAASGLFIKASQPQTVFPTKPKDRLAVATYPFRDGFKTLEEFAVPFRKTFGVSGIEPWGRHFASLESKYIQSLHRSFEKAGLHVVNVPVDISAHPCSADSSERSDAMAQYKQWVDAAVVLKSPGIRVHVPTGADKKADLTCAESTLRELAEYGEQKSIVVSLENDDPGSEDPDTIVKVIEAVNSPYLRALPDFCNSMLISDNPDYNRKGLQVLFSHAYSISHVKDSESDGKRMYRVDVPQIFGIAKAAGYKGYFSMEWEGEGDPYTGTKSLLTMSMTSLGGH
jgi:sugar phosphate isomerase/epimerase